MTAAHALAAVVAAVVAAIAALAATAAHANNGSCAFRVNGSLTLAFGSLDPSSGATVTSTMMPATLRANEAGDCRNVALTVSADNGLYFAGGTRRMSNGSDFIAYTLTLPVSHPAPGNNRWLTFGFTGTIAGPAYENASAGTYSDTVVISVNP